AVITIPAHFTAQQRQATVDASRAAGLEHVEILDEPTAAALAYGAHRGQEGRSVLVFDLGGGTLDISVLAMKGMASNQKDIQGDIRPLVDRAVALVRKTFDKVPPDLITDVLLVGGSTAIPFVRRAVADLLGPEKVRGEEVVNPMECVALGAAIKAAGLGRIHT